MYKYHRSVASVVKVIYFNQRGHNGDCLFRCGIAKTEYSWIRLYVNFSIHDKAFRTAFTTGSLSTFNESEIKAAASNTANDCK